MNRFVIISGCSGGGKSTLLDVLRLRGHAVVEEPGRRVVARELARKGHALPWVDAVAFAREINQVALSDRDAAEQMPGWVFFDRGLIDAAAALWHLTGEPVINELLHAHRYNGQVFLTPPWPEIYQTDEARRHGFADAVAEYDRLCEVYLRLEYEINILPKSSVEARADFIIAVLKQNPVFDE